MPSQITRQRHWIGRLGFVAVIAVVLGSCAWVFDWLTAPPDDQVDAEAHLDRPLLAYELWGDTPVIVWSLPETNLVYIDTLRLDMMPMGWPPMPRWQWTGNWSYIPVTHDPASLGYGNGKWGSALFGQIHDPEITHLRCSLEGSEFIEPVASPGYAVRLPDDVRPPESCDFLDASGTVAWTARLIRSEV